MVKVGGLKGHKSERSAQEGRRRQGDGLSLFHLMECIVLRRSQPQRMWNPWTTIRCQCQKKASTLVQTKRFDGVLDWSRGVLFLWYNDHLSIIQALSWCILFSSIGIVLVHELKSQVSCLHHVGWSMDNSVSVLSVRWILLAPPTLGSRRRILIEGCWDQKLSEILVRRVLWKQVVDLSVKNLSSPSSGFSLMERMPHYRIFCH